MGLAEFEWGAIPAALDLLTEQANQEQLVAGEHRGVYFVSPSLYEQGVCHVIDQLLDEDERKLYLVDYCGLAKALQARGTESAIEVVGWLELDNGFFFFADQDMFEKTKQLFGVSTDLPRQ